MRPCIVAMETRHVENAGSCSGYDVPTTELGVAAWGCVEAARRVLGEEARPMPDGLLERLR